MTASYGSSRYQLGQRQRQINVTLDDGGKGSVVDLTRLRRILSRGSGKKRIPKPAHRIAVNTGPSGSLSSHVSQKPCPLLRSNARPAFGILPSSRPDYRIHNVGVRMEFENVSNTSVCLTITSLFTYWIRYCCYFCHR